MECAVGYAIAAAYPLSGTPQLDLLASLDRTTLDMNPSWF